MLVGTWLTGGDVVVADDPTLVFQAFPIAVPDTLHQDNRGLSGVRGLSCK